MAENAIISADGSVDIDSFYAPHDKQLQLHTSTARNLLAIGGGGSGKSFFLLGEALYTAFLYPGSNNLLLRRDFPQLERGLILDFKKTVPKELYRWNDSKHIATMANGSMIFFGHLQNGSERTLANYLSAAFVFIGIDELGQFSYEAWQFLSWRNRVNKGCKPDANGSMPIPRMGGATNPLGPGYGWIKSMWVDKKPVSQLGRTARGADDRHYQDMHGEMKVVYDPHDHQYVHSTVLDNKYQLEADPEYITKLERLAPALRQKALYGDLNAVAGAYFQNFSHEQHVISLPLERDRIRWQAWQPIWLGLDWGLAHHTAVYWFTRAEVKGIGGVWKNVVVCFRELVVNETDTDELGDMIFERMKPAEDATRLDPFLRREVTLEMTEVERCKFVFMSPEQFARKSSKHKAHTVAAELGAKLHAHGLPYASEANNRRVDGAVFMYDLLAGGEIVIVEEACPHLIRTLQSVVRDEKNLEDVLKTETLEDDCYDAARYGLLSMLSEKGKPREIKSLERIQAIADPTARAIVAYQERLKSDRRSRQAGKKPRIVPRWQLNRK